MGDGPSLATHRRLVGKVAIITGGASGIGASTAKLFHEHGAKVVIADIQDHLGQNFAQLLGENACYIHCDVTNEDDVRNLIDTTISNHGKLDIMYNNAGILGRLAGGILDASKSTLDQLISVNLVGAFLGAKHAARVMVPRQQGCILFTASVCTAIGGAATPEYTVSKYGVVGLAKSLVGELGQHGIRVNCVSPYFVATPLFGLLESQLAMVEESTSEMGNLNGQVLKAEGVARAALYLASEEAYYVSGLNLVMDGGLSSVNPTLLKAQSRVKDDGTQVGELKSVAFQPADTNVSS